ncbi:MAG: acyl-CoA thioesterase/BAAT N-terminal domain-containing protein [Acidobacteriia bacterium]|nr:acyl-CoA thioesterase/BAAT N-terminal domain-containing protein [Terriglobia bacterium]
MKRLSRWNAQLVVTSSILVILLVSVSVGLRQKTKSTKSGFPSWIAWGADQQQQATFTVTPARPLMDERLAITVSGLPPRRPITIRARSRAHDRRYWQSVAVFTSDPHGFIDLAAQAPLSGTYSGVDGMGLFWSMQPDMEPKNGDPSFFAVGGWFEPIFTEIEAICDEHAVGSVRVERHFAVPAAKAASVNADGIIGVLYKPDDGRRHVGVIVLGGSEGGLGGPEAVMLAARGFTAFSLAYFGANRLPPTLQTIPIEYFGKTIHWMRSVPDVDPEAIALYGVSRGAEAALIAASIFPEIKAVVARSPSHVRWEGATANQLPGGPAWTYGGKPLPYVPIHIGAGFAVRYVWSIVTRTPVAFAPMFRDSLAHFDPAPAEIQVERIHGPLLLLSGNDDQIWPSSWMSSLIVERLKRNRHPYPDEQVTYAGVGHWLPIAYEPTAGSRQNMKLRIGGTPEGTSKAQVDAWPKIVRFLSTLPVRQASGK